jgi:hypothetical protein
MKTFWVTSLGSSQDPIKKLMSQMKTYGLEVQGHFWKDDLKKMAWMAARDNDGCQDFYVGNFRVR